MRIDPGDPVLPPAKDTVAGVFIYPGSRGVGAASHHGRHFP